VTVLAASLPPTRAAVASYHRGVVTPTIYEWAGGREAFARWLSRFYDLVEQEAPEIAAMFGGRVSAEHREHVTDWWTEVMGGPATYTEHRGGYEHMLAHHHNLAITAEQRLQFVTLLSRAADDAGLPADPEFRAAIMGYAEWGTRLALHNSQPGAETVAHAPVPRWGWGVAPPYKPDAD
jgi:hemoglobin